MYYYICVLKVLQCIYVSLALKHTPDTTEPKHADAHAQHAADITQAKHAPPQVKHAVGCSLNCNTGYGAALRTSHPPPPLPAVAESVSGWDKTSKTETVGVATSNLQNLQNLQGNENNTNSDMSTGSFEGTLTGAAANVVASASNGRPASPSKGRSRRGRCITPLPRIQQTETAPNAQPNSSMRLPILPKEEGEEKKEGGESCGMRGNGLGIGHNRDVQASAGRTGIDCLPNQASLA